MKITNIEVIELRVPDKRELDLDPTNNGCLVQVTTDAGITGTSEVDSLPSVVKAIVEAPPRINTLMGLKSILLGEDPTDISRLWHKMYHHTSYYGRRGVVMHAISGVDIALWDLLGKLESKPVHQLLGPVQRTQLPAYTTIYPLGCTADEVKRSIDTGLEYPVRALKIAIDPFWRKQTELAIELLQTARDHVGPNMQLMLDATASFSLCDELEPLLPALRDCNIHWLEAPFPLDAIHEHRKLSECGIPIGAGDIGLTAPAEWESMFDQGKIHIAQPDISWVGGFTGLQKVAEMAAERNCRLVPHGWNTDLTLASNLHFLAQHKTEEWAEFSTSHSLLRWELAEENLQINPQGMLSVPEAPGLGINLNQKIIERYRVS